MNYLCEINFGIVMIGDGFGPASQTFARTMMKNSVLHNTTLPLDVFLVGTSRTRSSDSDVTDSAAGMWVLNFIMIVTRESLGATAYSCGLKTYNNAVGVDPNKKP